MSSSSIDVAGRLPFNRKERFFTGTVLPMIIGCQDFRYLDRFLRRCGVPDGAVPDNVDLAHLAFFTEYGYAESLLKSSASPSKKGNVPADTPDVVIATDRILVAVEAKMYMKVSPTDLAKQLADQAPVIRAMQGTTIPDQSVAHVLLLPEQLVSNLPHVPGHVVTWEQVLSDYADVAPQYWLDVLRFALDHYSEFASTSGVSGQNSQAKLAGKVIADLYFKGMLPFAFVGRQGGLAKLNADFVDDVWVDKKYELSEHEPASKKNWVSIGEFIDRAKDTMNFVTTVVKDYQPVRMRHAVFYGPNHLMSALQFREWCEKVGGAAAVYADAFPAVTDGPPAQDVTRVHYVMQPDFDLNPSIGNALSTFNGESVPLGEIPSS